MSEEVWVKEAMTDAMLVAEVLLSLVSAEPPPPPPTAGQSSKNNSVSSSSSVMQLEWRVRQRRSKQTLRKKDEPARASPTTPLSWSGGTSVSGCGGADGSEESSRPSLKPVDNARSKVAATNETPPPKRSRKKKTLAELKEEMSSHLKENKSLKSELEMVKLKFENLRSTNETLSRKLQFTKERATSESSKRLKLDYQSHDETKTAVVIESKNAVADSSNQRELTAFHATNVGCNENDDPAMPNGSSEVHDTASCDNSFVLPDLNLPFDDDSGCEVLYGIS